MTLKEVKRKLPVNPGGTVYKRTTQSLSFPEDIAFLGTNTNYLAEKLKILEEEAAKMGSVMKIKLKHMFNTRNKTRLRNVRQFGGYDRVEQFKCSGGVVTEYNEVLVGNRCYYHCQKLLRSSL